MKCLTPPSYLKLSPCVGPGYGYRKASVGQWKNDFLTWPLWTLSRWVYGVKSFILNDAEKSNAVIPVTCGWRMCLCWGGLSRWRMSEHFHSQTSSTIMEMLITSAWFLYFLIKHWNQMCLSIEFICAKCFLRYKNSVLGHIHTGLDTFFTSLGKMCTPRSSWLEIAGNHLGSSPIVCSWKTQTCLLTLLGNHLH